MSAIAEGNQEVAAAPARIYRGARFSDIGLVHGRLMEVIDTSPFYDESFKAYEKARLSKDFLAGLIALNPYHVMVFEQDGKPAAFMISGPELGTLWLYWSYVFPEFRRTRLGFAGMGHFVKHWDNGKFHKIATYTKTGNDVAVALMKRYGYQHTATLEQHIFGETYLLYERYLNKIQQGYDRGVPGGFINRLRYRLLRAFGR